MTRKIGYHTPLDTRHYIRLMQSQTPPDALLLIAPGCPYCPVMLAALGELVKDGHLTRLEVINIANDPAAAREVGTRSVPWCRIGPFELEGNHTKGELSTWTSHATNGTGLADYCQDLLGRNQLPRAIELTRQNPGILAELLPLLAKLEETPMGVRIGINALAEELADGPALSQAIPALEQLATDSQVAVRGDAAHLLGLSRSPAARSLLQRLADDPHAEVREIANESLELLPA